MKAGDKVQVEVEKEIGFGLYNKFKHDAKVLYVGNGFVVVETPDGQRRELPKCKVHLVESESIEERLKKAEQKIKELERDAKFRDCVDEIRCSDFISVRPHEISAIDLLNKKIDELEKYKIHQEKNMESAFKDIGYLLDALYMAMKISKREPYSSRINYELSRIASYANIISIKLKETK